MSGLAEELVEGQERDDFWSWREKMYSLALSMNPESMHTIALNLYRKLKSLGYRRVSEFHYLHHDEHGNPYQQRTVMSEALIRAASSAGIELDLIPIYYNQGGFNLAPSPRQRRFISKDLDTYRNFVSDIEKVAKNYENIRVLYGVHSLRAAKKKDLKELFITRTKGLPFHLHIAEQEKEVEECLLKWGKRPIEWLLEQEGVDKDFELVHSIHANAFEIKSLASRNIGVVLCPSTEANLGDGIFPLIDFHHHGGRYSLGTDSHIGLNPFEEMRWLEYTQRLVSKRRLPLCDQNHREGGDSIFSRVSLEFKVGEKLKGFLIPKDTMREQEDSPHKWSSLLIYKERLSEFKEFIL